MVKDNAHSLLCYSTRVWAAALAAVTIQIYSIRVTNGIVDAINVFTLVFFKFLSTFFFTFFQKDSYKTPSRTSKGTFETLLNELIGLDF